MACTQGLVSSSGLGETQVEGLCLVGLTDPLWSGFVFVFFLMIFFF